MKDEAKNKGLIHVYTGEGKGKTTASFGLALRAAGHNRKVNIVQFLKGDYSGEFMACKHIPNLNIYTFGSRCKNHDKHQEDIKNGKFKGFCKNCFEIKKSDKERSRDALDFARQVMSEESPDVLILDEINCALQNNLLDVSEVLNFIESKNPDTELILTGRGAHPEIIKKADLVSEINPVKHYFDKGIPARKGIEF